MGFLQRIFSIRTKKNKKRPHIVHNVDSRLRAIEEEEHEAAVGRLLRSSSARYAVVSELDYASLPPLPHPINEVIQTPAASTISIASTSMGHRGTYNVTVHRRKQLALTQFPNANRGSGDQITTPRSPYYHGDLKDSSQLLGLRSDPSVASLLDMYDEHGRISSKAFSNSPPSPGKEGRAQSRRNGSTLRQLLGNPPSLGSKNGSDASAMQGDISWAERCLGETDSASSASSLGLLTPVTTNTDFPLDDPQHNNVHSHTTFASKHDLSTSTSENPAISSMEVELSIGAESMTNLDNPSKDRNPYAHSNPMTPQRASQVFGFLTEKRRSTILNDHDKHLPELPSAFSFSSDENSLPGEFHSRFSDNSSVEFACISDASPAIPALPFDSPPSVLGAHTHLSHSARLPAQRPTSISDISRPGPATSVNHDACSPLRVNESRDEDKGQKPHSVKVIMTAPTKVIVTAPTPSISHETPNRIPRGPRIQSRKLSPVNTKMRRPSTLNERSNSISGSSSASSSSKDLFTPILPRRRHSRHRTVSQGSSSAAATEARTANLLAGKAVRNNRNGGESFPIDPDKENGMGLTAKPEIPFTPLGVNSTSRHSRLLFRAAVDPHVFRPPVGMTPSPASSSELSPVGRQLMMNLRQQRTKAREADRRKSDKSGGRVARVNAKG